MAVRKEITYICDLCAEESIDENDFMTVNVPVKFKTNQTDGHPCKPYYTKATFDLCDSCMDKVTAVIGYGAQGYNTYYFRKTSEE